MAYENLGKGEFFHRIYDLAKTELGSYLEDDVYIVPDSDYCSTDDCVAGFLNPGKFKEEAGCWNEVLVEELCENLDKLENLMKQWKLKNLSELFTELEGGRQKDGFDYEMTLYRLRNSICNLSNRFTYACYKAVLERMDNGYEHSIKISDSTFKNISAHPEVYVIIDVYYK